MKRVFFYIVTVLMVLTLGIQGCKDENGDENGNGDNNRPTTPLEVSISGEIDHETHTPGQSGTITFNRFPATVAEWKQVREQIGEEPHGAVALQIMASEMYRRNNDIGKECLLLNNTVSNGNKSVNLAKGVFAARPYQMAAFLRGATWDNGYNPSKPYTMDVVVMNAKPYEDIDYYQAKLLYLAVVSSGHDSSPLPVSVLKTKKPGEAGENGKFYIVQESSSIYLQCKAISFEHPFNGLD